MKRQILILAGFIVLSVGLTVADAQTPAPAAIGSFVTQQPANEWLAHVFLRSSVQNAAGEPIGEIVDLVFDPSGKISTAVVGVGGFLGVGEKHVAVPYSMLTFKAGADGRRVIVVAATKDGLKAAPAFVAIEKTTYDKMKEGAVDLGQRSVDKAVELKDAAAKKIDDMTKAGSVKQ